jgi:hypothetical protein
LRIQDGNGDFGAAQINADNVCHRRISRTLL